MTEDERTALVDELAEAIWDAYVDGEPTFPALGQMGAREQAGLRRQATACIPIIDKLLAAHDLDALLDSVGRYTVIHHMSFNDDGTHTVEIGKWFEHQGRKYYRATGPTRMAAIRNAVAQAQGRGEGGV